MNSKSETFLAAVKQSEILEKRIFESPQQFRVLTGDRPTGRLHVGHLFGSLLNRVQLQNLGIETFVVIADYQVLTDRDKIGSIEDSVINLVIDYLAVGLDPERRLTHIFPHSHIPELNQLLVPFLTLASNSELSRNPTVKEEIKAAGLDSINAGMYAYPIHQAADILFCKANVVPVGKDQLPHLEIARAIAKRFNSRFADDIPIFPQPEALLSNSPVILGLDGSQKMSKSRNNAILLSSTEDETVKAIKTAKTDSVRLITYDPTTRPEISNLLLLASLCLDKTPQDVAESIGDKGSGYLKQLLAEALNEYLRPIRAQRAALEGDLTYISKILRNGVNTARGIASRTLAEVRDCMGMNYGI